MNVNWAMKIDRIAGAPLGLAARVVDRLRVRKPRNPGPLAPPRNIVVLKCLGFGSIIQMLPMLATLRDAYPDARITLLTFKQNEGLAALFPQIDEVSCIEFREGMLRFVLDTLSTAWRLRARRPELLIDGEFFSYYVALLTWLISRRDSVAIGYFNNRRTKDWIFTHAVSIDLSEHITEAFQKALAPLGLNARPIALEDCGIAVPDDCRESIEAKLAAEGVAATDRIVIVNINASDLCLNRRWPPEYYQALLRAIHVRGETGDAFIFIGGEEDRAYVAGCMAALKDLPGMHDFAGRTSLPELAALMQRASLFIGNDSGPLHLAEACGLQTISFFGPETPNLYGPRGERHRVFYDRPHCSPCLNVFYSKENNCRDNVCLKAILPGVVANTALELLERDGRSRD